VLAIWGGDRATVLLYDDELADLVLERFDWV
jgi:hypothetical protein